MSFHKHLRAIVIGWVILNVAYRGKNNPKTTVTAFPASPVTATRPAAAKTTVTMTTAMVMRPLLSSPLSSLQTCSFQRQNHQRRHGTPPTQRRSLHPQAGVWRTSSLAAASSSSSREEEIRRKIRQLKMEGKIGRNRNRSGGSPEASTTNDDDDDNMFDEDDDDGIDADDEYMDKIRNKLGKSKSRLLGFGDGRGGRSDNDDGDDSDGKRDSSNSNMDGRKMGRIGSIPELQQRNQEQKQQQLQQSAYLQDDVSTSSQGQQRPRLTIDPTLFDRTDTESDMEPPEMTEEELVELVAQRLAEKRAREDAAIEAASRAAREARQKDEEAAAAAARAAKETESVSSSSSLSSPTQQQMTTGVGGTWIKSDNNETVAAATVDLYKPKTGSWGAFPRPKDISKAYGGGRRVGAGFSNEDEDAMASVRTQRLLREYRQKVGIDVPTEKEHAAEIEEALRIGQLAMQRGIYSTAVSALEKVTQWCSTNSKVGSKVYLELAMAYEAVGRTKEAYQVYKTLTECRMEDVRYNAKRLLYGMEAIEIMRDVSSDFSRKKTRNTFIDATGLANIAQNFDDVYNTAYVDLEGGFYKKLTESVVRSNREARQILLKATGKGEVSRTKVVQALRCIARQFDESLESEIATVEAPTAYLNGKPIVRGAPTTMSGRPDSSVVSLGDFTLLSGQEMMQNLNGQWQLQLLADRQGDGVSFYNTTMAMQEFVIDDMKFFASGRSGLFNVERTGQISMDASKRILTRSGVETTTAGGLFSVFRGRDDSGFSAAVSRAQQIVSVDSILLITKCPKGSRTDRDQDKEHFAVWRRITPPGE